LKKSIFLVALFSLILIGSVFAWVWPGHPKYNTWQEQCGGPLKAGSTWDNWGPYPNHLLIEEYLWKNYYPTEYDIEANHFGMRIRFSSEDLRPMPRNTGRFKIVFKMTDNYAVSFEGAQVYVETNNNNDNAIVQLQDLSGNSLAPSDIVNLDIHNILVYSRFNVDSLEDESFGWCFRLEAELKTDHEEIEVLVAARGHEEIGYADLDAVKINYWYGVECYWGNHPLKTFQVEVDQWDRGFHTDVVNSDGNVNIYDVTFTTDNYGKTLATQGDYAWYLGPHQYYRADIDADGDIDIYDVTAVCGNYGFEW